MLYFHMKTLNTRLIVYLSTLKEAIAVLMIVSMIGFYHKMKKTPEPLNPEIPKVTLMGITYSSCQFKHSEAYPETLIKQPNSGWFQPVEGVRLHVYSAFFIIYNKVPYIGVLGAGNLGDNDEIYCQMFLPDGRTLARRGEYTVLGNEDLKYGSLKPYYIRCENPSTRGIILFSVTNTLCGFPSNNIEIHYPMFESPVEDGKIAICHPPVRDLQSGGAILEWLEYQRQMDVKKVIFNGIFNMSKEASLVLDYYMKHGQFVELNSWGSQELDGEFHSSALSEIALLHCTYKHIGDYGYFMYIQIGEYIVPKKEHVLDYSSLANFLVTEGGPVAASFEIGYVPRMGSVLKGPESSKSLNQFKFGLTTSIIVPNKATRMLGQQPGSLSRNFLPNLIVSRQVAIAYGNCAIIGNTDIKLTKRFNNSVNYVSQKIGINL